MPSCSLRCVYNGGICPSCSLRCASLLSPVSLLVDTVRTCQNINNVTFRTNRRPCGGVDHTVDHHPFHCWSLLIPVNVPVSAPFSPVLSRMLLFIGDSLGLRTSQNGEKQPDVRE